MVPRISVRLLIVWTHHQPTSIKTIMKKKFHHSSQWSLRVTLKQLEETMNARLPLRNLQKDQLLITSMLLKKQWTLLTLKQDFQVQPQTNLESFKSTTPLPTLPSTVEWNHMETSTQTESASDQLRLIKRLSSSAAPTKRAVDKRAQELEPKDQAPKRLRFPRATLDKCKVFNRT